MFVMLDSQEQIVRQVSMPSNDPATPYTISFPEPTCLLVSANSLLVLALTKRHVGSGNEIAPYNIVHDVPRNVTCTICSRLEPLLSGNNDATRVTENLIQNLLSSLLASLIFREKQCERKFPCPRIRYSGPFTG